MVRTGPDGALWVVDMYRYMIEHPEWLPNAGREELLPHYRIGDDMGRIYRISPVDSAPLPIQDLSQLNTPELVNALDSSNGWLRDKIHMLIVWRNDEDSKEPLSQLLSTIEQVKSSLNPALDIQGIVLTMFDARNNLSAQVDADVRSHFDGLVYDTVIPRNVRVSEAPSFGKPALLYDHKCSGSLAYMQLAGELVRRERARQAA